MRIAETPYIQWAKRKKGTWNLSTSGVPHATLAELTAAPADMPLAGDNAYGYEPLLERIARHYRVRAAEVVTATGCSMANFLTLAAIVEPGDEILMERPTYEPLLRAAKHLGAQVERFDRLPARRFEVDAEEVAARISPRTRAVVLTNLHNPSGHSLAQETLRHIGAAAERHGARVIIDEVYLDGIFDGTALSCVHLGPAFISTNSLTKIYGLSALRCGWVIAHEALARRVWHVSDLYENVRPFAPDWLGVAAFDRLDALRERSRLLLNTNRRVFVEWLHDRSDLDCAVPDWGTTICARPLTINAARLCELLREHYDVTVVPGKFFELDDHVRIALCSDTHVLREGLARIGECLDCQRAS
jgi:aspartate/methionine/tyrosine aminotransferase